MPFQPLFCTNIQRHFVVDAEAKPVLQTEWAKLSSHRPRGGLPQVSVDYISTEPHVSAMQASYPARFNKQDYSEAHDHFVPPFMHVSKSRGCSRLAVLCVCVGGWVICSWIIISGGLLPDPFNG